MKIAIIQTTLHWENPIENIKMFDEKIKEIQNIDLIILPEMFTSGFTMNPKNVAQRLDGEAIQWMIATAKEKNCAITGSLVITENNQFFNRLVFVFPNGTLEYYDKRHLFTLAGEDKVYESGKDRKIINYKDFKICPLICYDLRFPVFARNTVDYDLLIYVANWPKVRINAWDSLLKARAIENMTYTIGVNRIGFDDNNLEYDGHSQVIDYLGNAVLLPQTKDDIFYVEIEKTPQNEARTKFNFLNDRDSFILQ